MVLSCVLLSGCAPDEPRFRTEFFDYYALSTDTSVCDTVAGELDRTVRVFAEYLSVPVTTRGTYRKFPDAVSLQKYSGCSSGASACMWGTSIQSTKRIDEHELVHWVMAEEVGTSLPLLFAEGAANALSCSPHREPRWDDWDPRDFAVQLPITNAYNHAQAGRLMLGVLALTGDPRLLVELATLPRELAPDALVAAARTNFGVDLDAAWQRAVELDLGSCLPLRACTGEPLELGATLLEANCAGLPPRTLPVASDTLWAVRIRADAPELELLPCSVEGAPHVLRGLPLQRKRGTHELWLHLPAVPHAVWMEEARIGAMHSLELSVEPLHGAFSTGCPRERDLLTRAEPISLTLTGTSPVHFGVELQAEGNLRLTMDDAVTARQLAVEWCAGCGVDGEATECSLVGAMGERTRIVEGALSGVLRLTGAGQGRQFVDLVAD